MKWNHVLALYHFWLKPVTRTASSLWQLNRANQEPDVKGLQKIFSKAWKIRDWQLRWSCIAWCIRSTETIQTLPLPLLQLFQTPYWPIHYSTHRFSTCNQCALDCVPDFKAILLMCTGFLVRLTYKKPSGGYYKCEVNETTSRLLPMRFLHENCALLGYYAAISG